MFNHSLGERLCLKIDQVLQTVFPPNDSVKKPGRPNPADEQAEVVLNEAERRLASGLMRINHAGEVCAQGLYQGQGLTARLDQVKTQMQEAAAEEQDHLDWCAQRLSELNSRPSLLNPIWYIGSFTIGAIAGAIGDKWSLGFVAETERQVVRHLQSHLVRLPPADLKSAAILALMQEDEERHRQMALDAGAATFPLPIQTLMQLTSKIMTYTAFWI